MNQIREHFPGLRSVAFGLFYVPRKDRKIYTEMMVSALKVVFGMEKMREVLLPHTIEFDWSPVLEQVAWPHPGSGVIQGVPTPRSPITHEVSSCWEPTGYGSRR